jgi:cell division transport system permease protein
MFSKILMQIQIVARKMNKQEIMRAIDRMGLREYDLPLNKSEDSNFLTLLVCLMSFLAILALTGTFALSGMTARWSSGLENKITIEIPAETAEGHLLSNDTVDKETQKVANGLYTNPNIKSLEVMDDEKMQELLSPWIGNNLSLEDLPMPSLISVELKTSTADAIEKLKNDVAEISDYAIVQSHQDWLKDLIQFSKTLKFLALSIAVIIAVSTITAITAGIRTRMSIHKKEVELLHLMGASDDYIARQFQRHAMMISLQGSIIGTIAGISMTLLVISLSGFSGTSLIPQIEISISQFLSLCTIPLAACLIAGVTSRFTVLRALARMP